jgi:hypothetical protein
MVTTKRIVTTLIIIGMLGTTAAIPHLLDVPPALRTPNYTLADYPWLEPGDHPGSCVHASTITLLNMHNMEELADWWRNTYHSGDYNSSEGGIQRKLIDAGVKFAFTETGDADFLEWACRNRLGAVIFFKPAHCVNLVDFNETHAVILDNNSPEEFEMYPREEFLRRWRAAYTDGGGTGFALTLVYPPPPPWPIIP